MQHCQKLVLVPHETLTRLSEKPATRTNVDVMNDLDQEMNRILNQNIEDTEKWKLYEQALQKYLYFANEQKKPGKLIILDSDTGNNVPGNEAAHNLVLKERLLNIVPLKFKNNAKALFDHLTTSDAKSVISWDANGSASVGGQSYASIIDLISDAVRTRRNPKVVGWEKFASVLKSLHTPIDIIGNEKYLQTIQAQAGSGITIEQDLIAKLNSKTKHKHRKATRAKQHDKTQKNKSTPYTKFKSTRWHRWT